MAKPEHWIWSSAAEYSGVSLEGQKRRCGLVIDRVPLPADTKTHLKDGWAGANDHESQTQANHCRGTPESD